MSETSYSVSETAKILEVQSHVLRFWEEELHLPINRNEMGHRYYTRYDIQVLLAIKELKKKGLSLKEIGELIPFLYKAKEDRQEPVKTKPQTAEIKQQLSPAKRNRKMSSRKSAGKKTAVRQNHPAFLVNQPSKPSKGAENKPVRENNRVILPEDDNQVPDAFMEILDRLVKERMRTMHSGEERYKRLDERIRICQKSRREVAAAMEQEKQKSRKIFKKK